MFLTSLHLENFRNYQNLELNFDEGKPVTIFYGQNGQGKTNILESIYLLNLAKSFRLKNSTDLIRTGADFGRVKGKIIDDLESKDLEVFFSQTPKIQKVLKINQQIIPASQFIGQLVSVLFSPEDIDLVLGEPGLRRRFMNILLSQSDRTYFTNLIDYQAVLKNRNKLLLNPEIRKTELIFWDEKLALTGSYLISKRQNLINQLNQLLTGHYKSISQTPDSLELSYQTSIESLSLDDIKSEFLQKLDSRFSQDQRLKVTTVGPHRDDLKILLNHKNMRLFASRGEIRTAILSLKFGERDYLEKAIKKPPLLLLDDVFSELDQNRQQHLLKSITGYQTIITTTHYDDNLKNLSLGEIIYEVEEGSVKITQIDHTGFQTRVK